MAISSTNDIVSTHRGGLIREELNRRLATRKTFTGMINHIHVGETHIVTHNLNSANVNVELWVEYPSGVYTWKKSMSTSSTIGPNSIAIVLGRTGNYMYRITA